MCQHEIKNCPRCNKAFECKPGNITHCQCYGLTLTIEQKAFIEERYTDCLCSNCLLQLKNQVELFKEKFIYRRP
ncbi:MAG TPA: cysteine-rich CWC family protein [Chitinophagaceae bacterium]